MRLSLYFHLLSLLAVPLQVYPYSWSEFSDDVREAAAGTLDGMFNMVTHPLDTLEMLELHPDQVLLEMAKGCFKNPGAIFICFTMMLIPGAEGGEAEGAVGKAAADSEAQLAKIDKTSPLAKIVSLDLGGLGKLGTDIFDAILNRKSLDGFYDRIKELTKDLTSEQLSVLKDGLRKSEQLAVEEMIALEKSFIRDTKAIERQRAVIGSYGWETSMVETRAREVAEEAKNNPIKPDSGGKGGNGDWPDADTVASESDLDKLLDEDPYGNMLNKDGQLVDDFRSQACLVSRSIGLQKRCLTGAETLDDLQYLNDKMGDFIGQFDRAKKFWNDLLDKGTVWDYTTGKRQLVKERAAEYNNFDDAALREEFEIVKKALRKKKALTNHPEWFRFDDYAGYKEMKDRISNGHFDNTIDDLSDADLSEEIDEYWHNTDNYKEYGDKDTPTGADPNYALRQKYPQYLGFTDPVSYWRMKENFELNKPAGRSGVDAGDLEGVEMEIKKKYEEDPGRYSPGPNDRPETFKLNMDPTRDELKALIDDPVGSTFLKDVQEGNLDSYTRVNNKLVAARLNNEIGVTESMTFTAAAQRILDPRLLPPEVIAPQSVLANLPIDQSIALVVRGGVAEPGGWFWVNKKTAIAIGGTIYFGSEAIDKLLHMFYDYRISLGEVPSKVPSPSYASASSSAMVTNSVSSSASATSSSDIVLSQTSTTTTVFESSSASTASSATHPEYTTTYDTHPKPHTKPMRKRRQERWRPKAV